MWASKLSSFISFYRTPMVKIFFNKVDDLPFNPFEEQIKETQQTIITIYLY